jgi:urea transport system ATP-binding protein
MLRVSDVDVSYGRAQVLFGVSLEVPAGSLVCVMGRNGVGKTTLLNTIMGGLAPTAGTVEFDGQDITATAVWHRVRMGMAYVPQGHLVFNQLSVWENLLVVAEASTRNSRNSREAIDEALDVFPALRDMLRRPAGLLSGGQRQQLAIARALVTRPRLLVLDEPTEGIQPSVIDEIESTIERLHTEVGLTVLLVEQYLEFALRLADRFVIMDSGEVAYAGSADELHEERVQALLAV